MAVLPVDLQSYQGAVECLVIPMSDHFDLILGEDWCETTLCGLKGIAATSSFTPVFTKNEIEGSDMGMTKHLTAPGMTECQQVTRPTHTMC